MNFNDYINNFRIEAVKISLSNGEHKKSTLLGIAYDCGFNSKATLTELLRKTLAKLRKNTPTNKVPPIKKQLLIQHQTAQWCFL
jgi:AraC-like DNA-binding protein